MKLVRAMVITAVLICSLAVPAAAGEYTFSYDSSGISSVEGYFDQLADELPEELAQDLEGISLGDPTQTAENLREKLNFGDWIGRILNYASDYLANIVPSILPMLSLILLTAVAQAILPDSQVLKRSFTDFANLFAAVEIFRMTSSVVDVTQKFLENLCRMMNLFVPVIETVCLMSGRVTEKAVSGSGILLLITLIGNFNNVVLVPLTYLLFSLTCVTKTCGEVKLGGMVSGVRRFVMRLWSIMGILFSFLLGIQTVLARSADNLGTRAARFAIGSFIPVAGGVLSEAFTTVKEGLSFVRQAAGVGGILLILGILLSGAVPLALYKLTLTLTSSTAELLGVTTIAGLLSEIRGIIEFLLAVVLMSGLLFLLALILFTKTSAG